MLVHRKLLALTLLSLACLGRSGGVAPVSSDGMDAPLQITEPATDTPTDPPTERPTNSRAEFTFVYEEDETDFLNPERGFYQSYDLESLSSLGWIVNRGHRLAMAYIRLDDYRNTTISQDMLDKIGHTMGLLRDVGLKGIFRVTYNFDGSGQDASLDQVLEHISQLEPIFRANYDVIAVHQMGFVGAWGEAHSSSNNLDTVENIKIILEALWHSLHLDRNVQMRYPHHIMDQFPTLFDRSMAFSGSAQSRTGHHNDCFLSNYHDSGTYWPPEYKEEMQKYVEAMSPYVWIGGETCAVDWNNRRTDCATATAEMARFHWDFINAGYHPDVIDQWKDEGCYETISKSLGYRYRLLETTVQAAVAGEPMTVAMTITNDGWSGIKNPRGMLLILRGFGGETTLCVDCFDDVSDVRNLLPASGATESLKVTWNLPGDLASGPYELFFALPDPLLANNSAYSVRLANLDVWEPSTGYNYLGTVEVL